MKKFLTLSLSGIMLFCLVFSGVTALAENNFDMTVPDKNSYLYLETPVQIASDGDVVAILDDGLKKAVVSGPDEIRYVDCLDAFSYGKIWDMEFWNGNLFLLAEGEEFRLFCYDQSGNSVSPSWLGSVETPSAIAVRASELFVFDGYRTICKINLETEQTSSFKCKKPLFAKHIAADENFVYALSYSGILSEISLSDGSVSESAFSVSDTLDLLSYGGNQYKDYILSDIRVKYSRMLNQGATTFWETEKGAADFDNAGSLCHGWSAMPVFYLNELLTF